VLRPARTVRPVTAALVSLFLLAGCSGPAPGSPKAGGAGCAPPAASEAIRLTIDRRPDNALIVDARIELRAAAATFVEYGNPELGWLRTPTTAANTQHRLALLRLRPETARYQARAFALDPAGCPTAVATADFATGALPPQVKRFTATTSGQAGFELAVMDLRGPEPNTRVLAAYDGQGEPVWYYVVPQAWPDGPSGGNQMVVVQRPTYNLVVMNAYDGIYEITPDGHLVRRTELQTPPTAHIHHDLIELPDGRFLFIAAEDRTPSDNCERKPGMPIRGDTLHVVDLATGAEQKVWSAFDSLNIMTDCAEQLSAQTMQSLQTNQQIAEWLHTNSLSLGPRGNVILSFRRLDQIVSLSPDFSTIEWRLGGPGSSFSFPEDRDRFYGQHSAFELPGNRVLVFDNGRRRPTAQGGEYSRGLELELDFGTMTARKVWEFRPRQDIYADRVSNVVRLPNGNTLLNFGFRTDDPGAAVVLSEARPDGSLAWEQALKASGRRTSRYRTVPIASLAGERPVEPTALAGPG
jgi:hypothetical protein